MADQLMEKLNLLKHPTTLERAHKCESDALTSYRDSQSAARVKAALPKVLWIAAIAAASIYMLAIWAGWRLLASALPDDFNIDLPGVRFHLGDFHHRVAFRGVLIAMVLPAVWLAEIIVGGWRRSSLFDLLIRRSSSAMSDLSMFLVWQTQAMTVLMALFSLGLSLVSGAWIHQWIARWTGMDLTIANWALMPQLSVMFFVYSFFDYWSHRLDHTPIFWPLHRYHHSASAFSVLTAVRAHPAVFTGIVSSVAPAMILGAKPETIIDLNVLIVAIRYLIHSRISGDFGLIGRTLIQSPDHHRLHHRLESSDRVGHFALVPLWDRVFGTWEGAPPETFTIGVDYDYRHSLWIFNDIWRDYCDFWTEIVQTVNRIRRMN